MLTSKHQETCFTAWLDAHGAIPRKLSRVYAWGLADEEELYQEMLVQLWRSVQRFREQSKPSTWIYRVCLNTALTWKRAVRRREARVVARPEQVDAAICAGRGPAATHEHSDLLAVLMQAVRAMPPTDRTLIVLALDDLSYREIADVTGMSENHIGVALNRARKRLATSLKEVCDEL